MNEGPLLKLGKQMLADLNQNVILHHLINVTKNMPVQVITLVVSQSW